MLKDIFSSIINYILPYRCALCAELIKEKNSICGKCFLKVNFITSPYCNICGFPFEFSIEGKFACAKCIAFPPKFDLSRSLFKFDNQSKKLIHAFKYNDKTINAKIFAKLLFARYKQDIEDVDIIIPVPMYRFKRIFRNYNPPQILALEMAKFINKPVITDVLMKTKWTKAQTNLSKIERSKNLKNSIKILNEDEINGRAILLIDDVKTTGATSNACAHLLKKAGAISVKLVTISLS